MASPRALVDSLPASDSWLSGGQAIYREGNRPVQDSTWKEFVEKESRKHRKAKPFAPGQLRSIPPGMLTAQFSTPCSTYRAFCKNVPEPKVFDRRQLSAVFDKEQEARQEDARLRLQRDGHQIFLHNEDDRERHHMMRLRAEIAQQRQMRRELQEECAAIRYNEAHQRRVAARAPPPAVVADLSSVGSGAIQSSLGLSPRAATTLLWPTALWPRRVAHEW